jgi:hypothetical protein
MLDVILLGIATLLCIAATVYYLVRAVKIKRKADELRRGINELKVEMRVAEL